MGYSRLGNAWLSSKRRHSGNAQLQLVKSLAACKKKLSRYAFMTTNPHLQIDVLICTPSILAKHDPQDYPNLKAVAPAGEPSSQRYLCVRSIGVLYLTGR